MDSVTGLEAVPQLLRLQVIHKRFILGSGKSGGCPLTSHKACGQAGGLHAPVWRPGVVGQGGGALRGSSQELLTIQVLLLVAAVHACKHKVVQVFPEGTINMKVALLAFLCYRD